MLNGVTFITDRQHNVVSSSSLQIVSSKEGYLLFLKYINSVTQVGFDTENSSLDPFTCVPLLSVFGDSNTKFCFDATSVNMLPIYNLVKRKTLIGHNLKYDYSIVKASTGISLTYLWDTMIASQLTTKNTHYRYGLEQLVERLLGLKDVFTKSIRNQFIGMSKTAKFTNQHIEYATNDISYLFPLKEKLSATLHLYKQHWFCTEVEFPLISILAENELRGFAIDKEKWIANVERNKEVIFETAVKLDQLIRQHRENVSKENRVYLVGGKFDKPRIKLPKAIQYDMFSEPTEVKQKQNVGNINYNSIKLLDILANLNFNVPIKNAGAWGVPKLIKGKASHISVTPDNNGNVSYEPYTLLSPEIEAYLTANPNCVEEEFYQTLLKHKKAIKAVNSFGENFLDKIHPVTGRIHTIYRQCFADNGRLQSGGGKSQPDRINIQNIPAKKEYRTCFYDSDKYSIVTSDLSGAEVVIMADKANDRRLLELNNSDIHSHMAQTGWRNIYLFRAGVNDMVWNDTKVFWRKKSNPEIIHNLLNSPNYKTRELIQLARTFVVSKEQNNSTHRKPCKNLTFGSVYGCKPKKAAKTINVTEMEGRLYIETLEREIPATFEMVKQKVDLAYTTGYLTLNNRSNNRVWFIDVLQQLVLNPTQPINRFDYYEVEGAARNMTISGTQADMIKEAMVVIGNRIRQENWDCHLLAQVHDELVYSFPKEMGKVIFTDDKNVSQEVTFDKFVGLTMIEVANRYLKTMRMHADYQVHDTWIK